MRLSTGEIATILNSSTAQSEITVKSYSIDSRAITPGSLFLAIRGPRFDGHDFIARAFDRGAVAAVVEEGFFDRSSSTVRRALIPVRDTIVALQQLAQAVRRRW